MAQHKLFHGDKAEAAKWLPFAQAKLAMLRNQGRATGVYHPVPHVKIHIYRASGQEWINITAGGYILFIDESNGVYRVSSSGALKGRRVLVCDTPRCEMSLPPEAEVWACRPKLTPRSLIEAKASPDASSVPIYSSPIYGDETSCSVIETIPGSARRVSTSFLDGGDMKVLTQSFTDAEWVPTAVVSQGVEGAIHEDQLTVYPSHRVSQFYHNGSTFLVELDDCEGTGTYADGGQEILSVGYRTFQILKLDGTPNASFYAGMPTPLGPSFVYGTKDGEYVLVGYSNSYSTAIAGVPGGYLVVHSQPGPYDTPYTGDGQVYIGAVSNSADVVCAPVEVTTLGVHTWPSVVAEGKKVHVLIHGIGLPLKIYTYLRDPVFEDGVLVADSMDLLMERSFDLPGGYPGSAIVR